MSEYGRISAKVRTGHGKGVARQLRRQGQVPAVMYGQGGDNLSLTIDPHLFQKATDPARNLNTVFHVEVEQEGGAQTVPCMVVDLQRDAVRDHVLHVDFLRVDLEVPVERKIPVTYHGRAAGVMKGGKLKTYRRLVNVSAKPLDLPEELAIDLSPLDAGQTMRIKDVSLPNTTFLENPEAPLALVEAPKAKKEEEAAPAKGGGGKKGKK
ncbi:50S ribosomal protein L25 [Paraliomyxa miuraensis]|uniref:50S ribosomal protein L25 n=1 Tax=Paraliomyxa miuraensis TaxID=376150 RepID=UPI00224CB985|nr:50S ribosomal protein L25 [Paraliomyxa miuraensis]MCX4247626.1 50S ribosomal protein L25 [Paraliomyxa miuraensis]